MNQPTAADRTANGRRITAARFGAPAATTANRTRITALAKPLVPAQDEGSAGELGAPAPVDTAWVPTARLPVDDAVADALAGAVTDGSADALADGDQVHPGGTLVAEDAP